MPISADLKAAFQARTLEALTAFKNTEHLCVGVCAYISTRLGEDGVPNKVALGSLSCNGVKTFQYKKMISTNPSNAKHWDGHAWIEFPEEIIGEPSLFRTAKVQPSQSKLRHYLQNLGLLDKGALLISKSDALSEFGLKYRCKAYLKETDFIPFINGLAYVNSTLRDQIKG